jgi:hypothetical protein
MASFTSLPSDLLRLIARTAVDQSHPRGRWAVLAIFRLVSRSCAHAINITMLRHALVADTQELTLSCKQKIVFNDVDLPFVGHNQVFLGVHPDHARHHTKTSAGDEKILCLTCYKHKGSFDERFFSFEKGKELSTWKEKVFPRLCGDKRGDAVWYILAAMSKDFCNYFTLESEEDKVGSTKRRKK